MFYTLKVRYRFIRRIQLRIIRVVLSLFFKLWVKRIYGLENIPSRGPALLISNHLSYYDFIILGAFFHQNIVFVARKKIKQTPTIKMFLRWHTVIYIDRDQPGISFFREIIKHLEDGKLVVIYPEGTRSRTGKMSKPKHGFVKLAIKTNVPIVPVAMKGTYEILPPHKRIPRLRKCSVIVGEKIYISPENPEFRDIFFERRKTDKFMNLTKEQMETIAIRIMEKVRILANEQWNGDILEEVQKVIRREEQATSKRKGNLFLSFVLSIGS